MTVLAVAAALYLDQLTGADDPTEEASSSQPAGVRPLVLVIEEGEAAGAAVVDEIELHQAVEAASEIAASFGRAAGTLGETAELAQSQFNLRLTILIAAAVALPLAVLSRARAGEQERMLTLYKLHLKPETKRTRIPRPAAPR